MQDQVPISDLMILNNNIVQAIDNLNDGQLHELLTTINNSHDIDSIILDLADGVYDNSSQINLDDIKNGMVTNKINSIEDIIKVDESIIQNINTIETNKLILYDDITMFPETSDGEVDYTNKFKLKGKLVDLESSIEKIKALESSIEGLQKSLEQMETKINQHSHSSDQAAPSAPAPSDEPVPPPVEPEQASAPAQAQTQASVSASQSTSAPTQQYHNQQFSY